jgi:DNA-binding response OmpR family regulator
MNRLILIVDDSLTVRMDLAEAFDAAGFRTLVCASGADAREALAREEVGLVILDVVLPDTDGIELLQEIRAIPAPRMPFVLLLSTEAEVKDRIRGLKRGADDYVGKPYDTAYLIARATELLSSRASSPAASAAKLLLVDDSATFRAALQQALEREGWSVITAENGEDGLRMAATLRPAAILVDSMMPGIDGATLIRRVRLDAALRATPCVLLTASDEKDAELSALEAGADAFCRKEDLEVIVARVQAVLRNATVQVLNATSLLGPKRILAVDDSVTFLNELATMLRGEGYDVVLAKSGEEALEMLAAQSFDCILMDLVMPGLDGIETCRRIKAIPSLRDAPLIMLTAREDRSALIEGLSTGADDFISKSSEFEVLKARVRAQLRRKQFEDEHRSIREQLLRSELEATEARAAREIASTRARLIEELEVKNQQLESAYRDLQTTQTQLVHSAKMASLGELVAGVAHEINNPLAFVRSHLGTAQRNLHKLENEVLLLIAEASREHWQKATNRLAEMGGGLERIDQLVRKLRTFSRLDEGELKSVSMRECVDSLLTILAHRTRDRITVITRFEEPDVIECYASLLNQAIMNLVANAIDAIDGEGTITISTGAEGDQYVIAVKDTGPGIPEHLHDRIMEPFFTTKAPGQGTGLGLSISYSIVQKHRGALQLRNSEEGGTIAEIRIPLP